MSLTSFDDFRKVKKLLLVVSIVWIFGNHLIRYTAGKSLPGGDNLSSWVTSILPNTIGSLNHVRREAGGKVVSLERFCPEPYQSACRKGLDGLNAVLGLD